jgi:hypothetical protein
MTPSLLLVLILFYERVTPITCVNIPELFCSVHCSVPPTRNRRHRGRHQQPPSSYYNTSSRPLRVFADVYNHHLRATRPCASATQSLRLTSKRSQKFRVTRLSVVFGMVYPCTTSFSRLSCSHRILTLFNLVDVSTFLRSFHQVQRPLRDGRRLENIAWRLWHREVFAPTVSTEATLAPKNTSSYVQTAISRHRSVFLASATAKRILWLALSTSPRFPRIRILVVSWMPAQGGAPPRATSLPTTSASARSSNHICSGSQPSSRSPTTSASCSILDTHHRTSSAPNRLSADSSSTQFPIKAINPGRSSVHIGQIISSLLPEKVNLSRSPRLPAAPHGPVPDALDVLSLPTHHNLHNQPPNIRTAPTGVLTPPPPESREDPARRHHLTTFLPSSVSSVSSSSSCTSSASSIAGPSTPPSSSFMPAHITSSFGPPEAESHSGSATPRAPTSPTRTRSPANSSPRTSLYNSTHSNPSSPAAASHTNTNSNRLSISARAAPTPSPNPSNANPACHRPTVILTNPTPRPTSSSTPSQPLSPATPQFRPLQ